MSDATSLAQALSRWRDQLGPDNVLQEPGQLAAYCENTTSLQREVPAVLLPQSVEDVQFIVQVANDMRIPLYPVSRGKNWGMGSRLPVKSDCVVVDMSRMNRIRHVDREHLVAVVEPGVTQGQLHDFLAAEGIPAVFNVTGSGRETSLLGNAIERGVGYFSSRADNLSGLEVVLGTGECIKTGFGHFRGAKATHLYPYGLGAGLDGIFLQSNFGIITSAGISLIPRPQAHMAMLAKIGDPARFESFVQALVSLRKSGVLKTAVHIGNRARTLSTLGPLVAAGLGSGPEARKQASALMEKEGFGPWSAVAGVMGSRAALAVCRKEVRNALRGIAKVAFLDDGKLDMLSRVARSCALVPAMRRKALMVEAMRPLYGLSKGVPTDAALKSVYWAAGQDPPAQAPDPDRGGAGLIYFLPVIPMSGCDAAASAEAVERIFAAHGFTPYITYNMINEKSLEGVINVAFDRSDAASCARAYQCIDTLRTHCVDQGLYPYRLGIHEMQHFVSGDDLFWCKVRDMKQVFDPNHIIAPGRYNLV